MSDPENRHLATVQKIEFLSNIPNKDRIFLAKVLGYQVIVNKEVFPNLPQMCVYFEPDSVLDNENPNNAHLSKSKFRVRTIKMAGVYSEGFATPISHVSFYGLNPDDLKENQDITKEVKCLKYLNKDESKDRFPSGPTTKKYHYTERDPHLGPFPVDIIPRTDEPHLKSMPYMLNHINSNKRKIVITEKYDGMSATYFNGRFFSRNFEHIPLESKFKPSEYLKIAEKFDLINKTLTIPTLAIQGEIVGPGCNGNRLGLKELDFFVFNIFDTVNKKYLSMNEILNVCSALELKTVPIIPFVDLPSVDNFIILAESRTYTSGFPSEGIVVKTNDSQDPRISFKVVSRLYLDKIK